MDLFDRNRNINLLPYDGVVEYYGKILENGEADRVFQNLQNTIQWKNDEAVLFGKHIVTKRKVAWYGDKNYSYTYSNTTKQALVWTQDLIFLKQTVEQNTGVKFNSCLLNLYGNGEEGMAWHSDDEKALGQNTIIASFSLGAERKFSFKHKTTKESVHTVLEHGSLLVMRDVTQSFWLHSLPKSKKVIRPRINLTFRTILADS